MKEQAFVTWLTELLNTDNLDAEIKKIGESKMKELANQFNTEIWPNMEIESAKNGTKLAYINRLNGKCPEGFEVETFKSGGKTCRRCVEKKAGGCVDKKQEGGKYNESEHAILIEKHKNKTITPNESKRLQELNRTSGRHEDGWKPKKEVKKEVKKHEDGGQIELFLQSGKQSSFFNLLKLNITESSISNLDFSNILPNNLK